LKILFASTADAGHVNPLIAIALMAQSRGDDVVVTTGARAEDRVKAAGLRYYPRITMATRTSLPIMPSDDRATPQQTLLEVLKHGFIDDMPAQAQTLRNAITEEQPDIIISDLGFLGRVALFLDPDRPPIPLVCCGITYLSLERPDGAPTPMGLPPARNAQDLARYAELARENDGAFNTPIRAYMDEKLNELALPALPFSLSTSLTMLCDAYIHPTVPAFEYDFGDLPKHIHFVGSLPLPKSTSFTLPGWWREVDDGRTVIVVTQGTVANDDMSDLIEPTIASLSDRDDLLVIVTTGGRPITSLSHPLPSNVRAVEYVDYNALLPKASLLITNGGYGAVSAALRFGIPVIAAGRSQDKAEVGARVEWSGVGIELATQHPTEEMLRSALDRILSNPSYRDRAQSIASDIGAIDTKAEILGVIDRLVARSGSR